MFSVGEPAPELSLPLDLPDLDLLEVDGVAAARDQHPRVLLEHGHVHLAHQVLALVLR